MCVIWFLCVCVWKRLQVTHTEHHRCAGPSLINKPFIKDSRPSFYCTDKYSARQPGVGFHARLNYLRFALNMNGPPLEREQMVRSPGVKCRPAYITQME